VKEFLLVTLEISINQPYVTVNRFGLNLLLTLRKTIYSPEITREVVVPTPFSEDLNLLFNFEETYRSYDSPETFFFNTINYAYECEALTG
jgi:hypothetical protein